MKTKALECVSVVNQKCMPRPKIRFSSDVFIPNDVLLNFYSLVIVINYVIEKNDEFIPEIYINEGYFTKV